MAPEIDEEDAKMAEYVADLVVGKLGNVVPAVIPAEVAEVIKRECPSPYYTDYLMPVGSNGVSLVAEWAFSPDGSIGLVLRDVEGRRFWRGVFRG